jgi:putative transposase
VLEPTCRREGIEPSQLTLHADRGSSMTSQSVAPLLSDLGVSKTQLRPHVSNDNPFSESNFKTLKYRPDFPDRFGCIEDSRAHCGRFFDWYNHDHRHGSLGLLTPAQVHRGRVDVAVQRRRAVLDAAFLAHPERFVRGAPKPALPPAEVWINKPTPDAAIEDAAQ